MSIFKAAKILSSKTSPAAVRPVPTPGGTGSAGTFHGITKVTPIKTPKSSPSPVAAKPGPAPTSGTFHGITKQTPIKAPAPKAAPPIKHLTAAEQAKLDKVTASLTASKAKTKAAPVATKVIAKTGSVGAHAGTPTVTAVPGGGVKTGTPAKVNKSTGTVDPLLAQATALVDASLTPQQNAIQRQIDALNAQAGYQVDTTNQYAGRQQSDLGEIYGRLANYTGGLQSAGDAGTQDTLTKLGGIYDALKGKVATTGQQAQSSIGDELARLGITQVAPQALEASARDQAYLGGLADTNASNAQGNATQQGASFDKLMTQLAADNQSQGTSLIGKSKTAAQDAIQNILQQQTQGVTGLQGQLSDLQGSRASQIQQLYNQLYSTSLDNQLKQQQLGLDSQYKLGQLGVDQLKAQIAAGGGSALDQAKTLAQIQLYQAQANKALNPTASATSSKLPTGVAGANAVLGQAITDPTKLADAQQIIAQISSGSLKGQPVQTASGTLNPTLVMTLLNKYLGGDNTNKHVYDTGTANIIRTAVQQLLGTLGTSTQPQLDAYLYGS